MCLATCPHSLVPRHRSALSCLTASLMGTASPASTTSMTEGGDTRHGRGGTLPCRTRATGLWEHGEDAHGLSGFRTGHPAARPTMSCRACATGPLLRVCPHLHASSGTPAGPPDRVDRGGVVRQQHHRPLRAGAPWAAALAHRSGARSRVCAILSTLPPSPPCWQVCRHGQPWESSVLGRTSRSLPCVPQRAPGLPASAKILTRPAAYDDSRPGPLGVRHCGTPPRCGIRRTRASASCWHCTRPGASPSASPALMPQLPGTPFAPLCVCQARRTLRMPP